MTELEKDWYRSSSRSRSIARCRFRLVVLNQILIDFADYIPFSHLTEREEQLVEVSRQAYLEDQRKPALGNEISRLSLNLKMETGVKLMQEKMRGQRGRLPVQPLGYVMSMKVIFRRSEVFVLAEVYLPRRPHAGQLRSDV